MRKLDGGWHPSNRRVERMPLGQRLALGLALILVVVDASYHLAHWIKR